MYCSNCGQECSSKDTYCANCGNKIVPKFEVNEKNLETNRPTGGKKGDFVSEFIYSLTNKGIKQVFCIASLVMTLFFLINISSSISDWLLIISALIIVVVCIKESSFFSTEISVALSAYALSFLTIDIPHIINRISKKTNTRYSVVTVIFHILVYMVVAMYFYCKSEVKKTKTDSVKNLLIVSILLELFSALWLIRVTYWKSVFLGLGYVIFGAILLYFINLSGKHVLATGEQSGENLSNGADSTGEKINVVAAEVLPSKIKDRYPNTALGVILGIALAIVIVIVGTSIRLISSGRERKSENTNETYYAENVEIEIKDKSNIEDVGIDISQNIDTVEVENESTEKVPPSLTLKGGILLETIVDDCFVELNEIDPKTGEITNFVNSFWNQDSDYLSLCCHYNSDYSLMSGAKYFKDGSSHIGYFKSNNGEFVDVSEKIVVLNDFSPLIKHSNPAFFENYLYFYDLNERLTKRVPMDNLTPEAVEVISEYLYGCIRQDGSVAMYMTDSPFPDPSSGIDWISENECVYSNPQKRMIYKVAGLSDYYMNHQSGGELTPLIPDIPGRTNSNPVISPDNQSVAFFSELNNESPSLFIVSIDGGDPIKVPVDLFGMYNLILDWN